MCSSVLNGNSAQENTVSQTGRAGTEKELCSSRCPHTISYPAFTGVWDTTESAYFSLLFLVQSSWNPVAVLMVNVFHWPPSRAADSPWLWPSVNSTTGSCACSNWRNYNTVFDTSSAMHFCPHLQLSRQFMAELQGPWTTNVASHAKLSNQQESFRLAPLLKNFCSICTRTTLL